jgi:hypothetical protein
MVCYFYRVQSKSGLDTDTASLLLPTILDAQGKQEYFQSGCE